MNYPVPGTGESVTGRQNPSLFSSGLNYAERGGETNREEFKYNGNTEMSDIRWSHG